MATKTSTSATTAVVVNKPAPVIDPGILAIRAQAKEQVAKLKADRASKKVLDNILTKRLPKLTRADRTKLSDELAKIVTPPLPMGAE